MYQLPSAKFQDGVVREVEGDSRVELDSVLERVVSIKWTRRRDHGHGEACTSVEANDVDVGVLSVFPVLVKEGCVAYSYSLLVF